MSTAKLQGSLRCYRIAWHAKEYLLSGMSYFAAANPDAAIEACRARVMRDHDMAIVIDSCVIDDWRV